MKTGYQELDEKIGGLEKGKLYMIASRPAMGKSTLGFNIINNVIKDDKKVLNFNFESTKESILEKIITLNSSFEYLEENEIKKFFETMLFIDDTASPSIKYIYDKATEMKDKYDISLILIDYYQLVNKEGKETTLAELKKLAQKLEVPIIIFSQVSRDVEKSENKRPQIDIAFSNKKELEWVNTLMFLYRDEYYNSETKDKDIMEVIVAKNSVGECSTVKLRTKFECYQILNVE